MHLCAPLSANSSSDGVWRAQVYWISRGKVKPANRTYSTVRNDYTISLDNGCAGPPLTMACQTWAARRSDICKSGICSASPSGSLHHYLGDRDFKCGSAQHARFSVAFFPCKPHFKHRLLLASGSRELSVITSTGWQERDRGVCGGGHEPHAGAAELRRQRLAARLHRQAPAGAPPALVYLTELCHNVACSCLFTHSANGSLRACTRNRLLAGTVPACLTELSQATVTCLHSSTYFLAWPCTECM